MFIFWIGFILECLFMHLMLPAGELALPAGEYMIYVLLAAGFLLCILYLYYRNDSNFTTLIILGFILRMALMIWSEYFSHIFTLPNSGADEWTYYYNGMSALVKGKEFTGYALVFSWQARIFGLSKLFGKFVNVLFSVSSIVILRNTLLELGISERHRISVISLACFMPNYAIVSSLLLRESLIVLLIMITIYFFVKWWMHGHLLNLIVALASSIFASWLHSGMIIYTIGILCISFSAQKQANEHFIRVFSLRTLVISLLVATFGMYILLNSDTSLTTYFRDADSVQDIVSISDAYEDGGSAYNANIFDNESTIGFILNTPIRMFYFLMAPLPWNWRSLPDIVAFVFSALIYATILINAIKISRHSEQSPLLPIMVVIALLMLMIFGWGVSNSGTALRHRDKMIMHYLIMYALYLKEQHNQHSGRTA